MNRLTTGFSALLLAAACQPADAPATDDPAGAIETGRDEAASTADAAPDAPVALVEVWSLSGFSAPEGIAAAPDGGYFISNVSGTGGEKDGSGWVSKISAFGEMIEPQFATGMDAPQGMVVDRGILYVADIDRVHLVDPDDGTLMRTINIDGARGLNDMAAWNASLVISDSAGGKIYRLSGDAVDVWLEDERLKGVNGLTPDGDRLLVSTMTSGSLYEVTEAMELNQIATGMKNADGVGRIDDGYLVSSWPGQVWHVTEDGAVSQVMNTQAQGILQNDLTVFGDTVIIPNWLPGSVTAWSVQAD